MMRAFTFWGYFLMQGEFLDVSLRLVHDSKLESAGPLQSLSLGVLHLFPRVAVSCFERQVLDHVVGWLTSCLMLLGLLGIQKTGPNCLSAHWPLFSQLLTQSLF